MALMTDCPRCLSNWRPSVTVTEAGVFQALFGDGEAVTVMGASSTGVLLTATLWSAGEAARDIPTAHTIVVTTNPRGLLNFENHLIFLAPLCSCVGETARRMDLWRGLFRTDD